MSLKPYIARPSRTTCDAHKSGSSAQWVLSAFYGNAIRNDAHTFLYQPHTTRRRWHFWAFFFTHAFFSGCHQNLSFLCTRKRIGHNKGRIIVHALGCSHCKMVRIPAGDILTFSVRILLRVYVVDFFLNGVSTCQKGTIRLIVCRPVWP